MKNITFYSRNLAAVGLLLTAVACGGSAGGGGNVKSVENASKEDPAVDAKAAAGYKEALDAFAGNDRSGWSPAACDDIAQRFMKAAADQKSAGGRNFPEAYYNAGLAHQRCGDDEKAKASFKEASQIDKEFHRPRAQLALYRYKENGNIDAAIQELDQIIRDAKFQNVEGLVALAALQMQRGGSASGPGCKNDLSCAQLNLQRSLALDDAFMPAFNQLALYYLEQARGGSGKDRGELVVAGSKKKRVNKQRLDLAALVASQAQMKNPNYAPIHNTTGLILVELENYNGAVKAFGRARKLNPKLFEAQMNYAAVSLSFRGFGEAATAYREAIKLQPKTYEAHLGLALALRGMISNANYDKNVAEAQKHLDEAKKIAPNRAEAFYNEAILTEEYRAKKAVNDSAKIKEFEKAKAQYESFVRNAQGKSAYKDAIKVSEGRIEDIEATVAFMRDGVKMAAEQKKFEAQMKKDAAAKKEADKKAAAAKKADVKKKDTKKVPPAKGDKPAPAKKK